MNADGTYYLEVYRVSGIEAANQRLAAEGIRARIYEEQPQGDCPEFTWGDRAVEGHDDLAVGDLHGWTLKRDVPAGLSVLMTLNESPEKGAKGFPLWSAVSTSVVRGDPPSCVQAWHERGPIPNPSAPTPTP
jgi:hypothetical protein